MVNKIDFIGIGSGKSGSTWLWTNLIKHPEISSSNPKEINFFSTLFEKKTISWYHNLFEKNQLVKGEFSVTYLDDNNSAQRIYEYSNQIKIICILRRPTERIISDYYHSIRKGTINHDLALKDFIKDEKNLSYGRYKSKIQNFKKYFSDDQMLILEMEACLKSKKSCFKKIYNFLKLKDKDFVPQDIDLMVNKGFIPKIRIFEIMITFISINLTNLGLLNVLEILKKTSIHHIIRKFNSKNKLPKTQQDILQYLNLYFKEDISFFKEKYGFTNW